MEAAHRQHQLPLTSTATRVEPLNNPVARAVLPGNRYTACKELSADEESARLDHKKGPRHQRIQVSKSPQCLLTSLRIASDEIDDEDEEISSASTLRHVPTLLLNTEITSRSNTSSFAFSSMTVVYLGSVGCIVGFASRVVVAANLDGVRSFRDKGNSWQCLKAQEVES
jgi:hypothetical protein